MSETVQYTIRGVPKRTDAALRRLSRESGTSLNRLAVDLLNLATGSGADAVRFHDLDDLAGSWVADPAFDQAIASFEAIDRDLWK